MGMATGPSKGVKSEINVTPLVDVVLVLLIIFMVVTPMLQRGKDVRLPKAQRVDQGGDKDPRGEGHLVRGGRAQVTEGPAMAAARPGTAS